MKSPLTAVPVAPLVTVLMPVHNGGDFLAEAISSVLDQTMQDLELLIVDDGSTDDSMKIVRSFHDPRIRIHAKTAKRGIAHCLNDGLDAARAPFVARLDADDVALPNRLGRQLEYMRNHPDIGVCGSWFYLFDSTGTLSEARVPEDHHSISARLLFGSPFGHSTVMFDMRRMNRFGLRYSTEIDYAADYDLWERTHSRLKMGNLPEFLLKYRLHPKQVSKTFTAAQRRTTDAVRARKWKKRGIRYGADEFLLHCELSALGRLPPSCGIEQAFAWLGKLRRSAGPWGRRARALRHECDYWENHVRHI